MKNSNVSPIADLVKLLKEDTEYRYSWQANIAMAFYDEYKNNSKSYKNTTDLHTIANKAADNFLKLLCYENK